MWPRIARLRIILARVEADDEGDPRILLDVLSGLGMYLLADRTRHSTADDATVVFRRAVAIAKSFDDDQGDQLTLGMLTYLLARAYDRCGMLKDALSQYCLALDILQPVAHEGSTLVCYARLGIATTLVDLERSGEAVPYLEAIVSATDETNASRIEAVGLLERIAAPGVPTRRDPLS